MAVRCRWSNPRRRRRRFDRGGRHALGLRYSVCFLSIVDEVFGRGSCRRFSTPILTSCCCVPLALEHSTCASGSMEPHREDFSDSARARSLACEPRLLRTSKETTSRSRVRPNRQIEVPLSLGLSSSSGAIWWLTRIQKVCGKKSCAEHMPDSIHVADLWTQTQYSSYAFGTFSIAHFANTAVIPLLTRSVPASEPYLLLTRPYYSRDPFRAPADHHSGLRARRSRGGHSHSPSQSRR